MNEKLAAAQANFIEGTSRISSFWGFPKAMGALYGALYLSPTPLGLDELVQQVSVTKGAVSVNVRQLERLGMVHKHLRIGERKDYYTAETDFWKIIKGILREREKNEFDAALRAVSDSLAMLDAAEFDSADAELAEFTRQRLQALANFFRALDNLVATVLALEELRSSALARMLGGAQERSK